MSQVRDLFSFLPHEISTLFREALPRIRNHSIVILCAPQKKNYGRLLVVTPARIGPAHMRNRIKRQLKAIFFEKQLYAKGLDCIVIVRKGGLSLRFQELVDLLTRALSPVPHETHKN